MPIVSLRKPFFKFVYLLRLKNGLTMALYRIGLIIFGAKNLLQISLVLESGGRKQRKWILTLFGQRPFRVDHERDLRFWGKVDGREEESGLRFDLRRVRTDEGELVELQVGDVRDGSHRFQNERSALTCLKNNGETKNSKNDLTSLNLIFNCRKIKLHKLI